MFFALMMVNSCNQYSCAFSDVLGVLHIASAASLQLIVDHGGELSGKQEMFSLCLQSSQIE